MATKRKLYKYEVEGHHRFPLDMLRYDRCWPAKQSDVTAINEHPGVRRIGVLSSKPPTVERWASFGWTVFHVRTETDLI